MYTATEHFFGQPKSRLRVALYTGGALHKHHDTKGAQSRSHVRLRGENIVVGTLGKLKHAVSQGDMRLDNIHWLILDEVSYIFNRGRNEAQVTCQNIVSTPIPETTRTVVVDATLNTPESLTQFWKLYCQLKDNEKPPEYMAISQRGKA